MNSNQKLYSCACCMYETTSKSDYNKHLQSKKHIKNLTKTEKSCEGMNSNTDGDDLVAEEGDVERGRDMIMNDVFGDDTDEKETKTTGNDAAKEDNAVITSNVIQDAGLKKFDIDLNTKRYRGKTVLINKKTLDIPTFDLVEGFIEEEKGISFKNDKRYKDGVIKYETELIMMKKYRDLYDSSKKAFVVEYKKKAHGWGRVVPTRGVALNLMHRPTRHAICRENYVDIDMKNAHPQITYEAARRNGISMPNLKKYLEDTANIRKQTAEYYGVEVKYVKELYILLMYGGGVEQWRKKYEIDKSTGNLNLIIELKEELRVFRDIVWEKNEIMRRDIEKYDKKYQIEKKKAREERAIYHEEEGEFNIKKSWEEKNDDERKRTIMSYWCQSIEQTVQEAAISYISEKYDINIEHISPAQDGFMLYKEDYKPEMLEEIEKHILNTMHLEIKFVNKPFDEADETIRPSKNKKKIQLKDTYEYIKQEFENTHFKIVGKSIYAEILNGGGIRYYREADLMVSYKHIKFLKIVKNKRSEVEEIVEENFIKEWIDDKYIRKYQDTGTYPGQLKCPDEVYNLWTPYAGELIETYCHDKIGLELILDHLSIMCNNEKNSVDYILDWIAHMIQYPEYKSTCPVFISQPGSGKNTSFEILALLIGKKKVLETADPSEEVWGKFNAQIENKSLILLNELSKKQTKESIDKIKKLITDQYITYNEKGVKRYESVSYHRFIAATNSEEPLPVEKNDRRFPIFRCSDEKKNDGEYFSKLRKKMEDKNVIKTVYEYFKMRDISEFNPKNIPQTEWRTNLQELERTPIEQFLMDYVTRNQNRKEIVVSQKDLHDEYKNYIENNGIDNNDALMSTTSLAIRILRIPGIEKGQRTKDGNIRILKINVLKKHFGIGALIETQDNDADDTNNGKMNSEEMLKYIVDGEMELKYHKLYEKETERRIREELEKEYAKKERNKQRQINNEKKNREESIGQYGKTIENHMQDEISQLKKEIEKLKHEKNEIRNSTKNDIKVKCEDEDNFNDETVNEIVDEDYDVDMSYIAKYDGDLKRCEPAKREQEAGEAAEEREQREAGMAVVYESFEMEKETQKRTKSTCKVEDDEEYEEYIQAKREQEAREAVEEDQLKEVGMADEYERLEKEMETQKRMKGICKVEEDEQY